MAAERGQLAPGKRTLSRSAITLQGLSSAKSPDGTGLVEIAGELGWTIPDETAADTGWRPEGPLVELRSTSRFGAFISVGVVQRLQHGPTSCVVRSHVWRTSVPSRLGSRSTWHVAHRMAPGELWFMSAGKGTATALLPSQADLRHA